jgi:hypothetical protein
MLAGEFGPGFGRAPNDTMKALALAHVATSMRGCGAGSHLLPEVLGEKHDPEKRLPVFEKTPSGSIRGIMRKTRLERDGERRHHALALRGYC